MINWQLLLRIMSLGAALSSTKSISLAGSPRVVLVEYTSMSGTGTVNNQIVDFCSRRCRMAWPPHLMIGFACAEKFPGVLFWHQLCAISNTRSVWSGSCLIQRTSALKTNYKIMQRSLLLGVSDPNPPTLCFLILDRQRRSVPRAGLRYLGRDRAINIGAQIPRKLGSKFLTASSCSVCNGRATYRAQTYITSSYQPPHDVTSVQKSICPVA